MMLPKVGALSIVVRLGHLCRPKRTS
ncbi:hypothetical protein JMJ77_0011363 [Colletotrichum scovillei]|uniref:Uncharacterized protein n=1 Tax=Colletotrichum scovillei TaxID=1209932 RepID=A0A9P7UGP7_9PEZI|nr:hypothetical protein JMJ77_0011363 [Colletotrichum scovillei]KAG7060348.1 hypothetical protein JMJ78_0015623 [Colletotrichum scovillei]KAG7067792.1 hypothetical protein JMJ76_0009220 [Colletotrichum scovillei]